MAEMPYYGDSFKIWCLEPRVSHATPNSTLPKAGLGVRKWLVAGAHGRL